MTKYKLIFENMEKKVFYKIMKKKKKLPKKNLRKKNY